MKNNIDKLWTTSFIYACLANFLTGIAFYLLTATLPFFLVEQYSAGKSIIGIALASYVIAALIIRPFSGYLADSFPRKTVYIISLFVFICFFWGYLIASTLTLFLIIRTSHGFAWGCISTSSSTLAIDIMPSSRRGEGIGYYGLTTNFSMAIGPLIGIFLHDNYTYNHIFFTSIITGFLGFLLSFFIKAPQKEKILKRPISMDRFILIKAIPIGINTLLFAIPYGIIISFSAMYGKELNISNTGMFFTYMAIGIGISRIFSGKLVDQGKIHFICFWGFLLLSISFLLFSLSNSPTMFFASAFCIGLGQGSLYPAFNTLFVDMATHSQRGSANSTYLTSFDIGMGIGMILGGKIAEITSLASTFFFSSIIIVIALVYYQYISKLSYNKNRIIE